MKIGVMFGSPETTTGGNALKFYASVRMDIRRVESITKGEETIGNHVRVKVVKNKVAPPFRKAEFDIFFNQGISRESSIIEEAVNVGVLQKSGTWFSYADNRLGQGKENVRQYLVENAKLCDEIEAKVRQAHADGTAKKLLAEKEKATKGGKAAAATEEVA
jgi:recombination protein RecA